jgi:hypothetical protein
MRKRFWIPADLRLCFLVIRSAIMTIVGLKDWWRLVVIVGDCNVLQKPM